MVVYVWYMYDMTSCIDTTYKRSLAVVGKQKSFGGWDACAFLTKAGGETRWIRNRKHGESRWKWMKLDEVWVKVGWKLYRNSFAPILRYKELPLFPCFKDPSKPEMEKSPGLLRAHQESRSRLDSTTRICWNTIWLFNSSPWYRWPIYRWFTY